MRSNSVEKVNLLQLDITKEFDLGTTHQQCCSARAVGARIELTSLATNESFGTSVLAENATVGILNTRGDESLPKTFHGARAKRGNDFINQSITCSFDPSSLLCLACKTEHQVVQRDKPVVLILSDQNFNVVRG